MNFLIVGTGELAKLALKVLFEEGITNVVIVGDEVEAVRLAERFGIRSVDVSRLADYFIHADVVIAVGAEEIDKDNLPPLRAEGLRDKGNRIILDMGVPPNFEAETAGMLAEEYYSLDDLRRLQPSPLEAFGGVEAAWRMVLRSAGDFCFLLQLLQHSPVLNAYLSRQFAIKNVDLQSKPRKKVRSMFTFLKSDNILRVDRVKGDVNMRVQLNNHVAEDASDVVKNVKKVRRFNYWLSDN